VTPPRRILLDLDGTLVDRQRAFERWAERLVGSLGGGAEDLAWLIEQDAEGYRPRRALAAAIAARFPAGDDADLLEGRLRLEVIEGIACYDGVVDALRRLRSLGSELVLVTNGTVAQQTAKLERTGLGPLLDRVVISEAAGVKKPDPRIFTLAVEGLEGRVETWMIGDHPSADIEGGRAAGLSTGWPHPWEPTLTAPTTAELLDALLARHR
jgi:putative hydrolase of the HAD superfamily